MLVVAACYSDNKTFIFTNIFLITFVKFEKIYIFYNYKMIFSILLNSDMRRNYYLIILRCIQGIFSIVSFLYILYIIWTYANKETDSFYLIKEA